MAGQAHRDAGSHWEAGNGFEGGRGCSKGRAELDPLLLTLCPDHRLRPLAAAEQGRWHRNSPQILPAGRPPSRAHPQLLPLPSGQPRGERSICKPAPSTSSQRSQTPATPSPKANLPFAMAAAPSLPVRHSRARQQATARAAQSPTGARRPPAFRKAALEQDRGKGSPCTGGQGAAGARPDGCRSHPPGAVTARGRRNSPAFHSRVSEPTPPEADAGDSRAADAAVFHNCKWLALPPPPPTFGVRLKSRCRLCISCSSPVEAFLLVYWSSPSHRIPVERRSLHFLGTSCIH